MALVRAHSLPYCDAFVLRLGPSAGPPAVPGLVPGAPGLGRGLPFQVRRLSFGQGAPHPDRPPPTRGHLPILGHGASIRILLIPTLGAVSMNAG